MQANSTLRSAKGKYLQVLQDDAAEHRRHIALLKAKFFDLDDECQARAKRMIENHQEQIEQLERAMDEIDPTRRAARQKSKAVIQMAGGQEAVRYSSAIEAAEASGISLAGIRKCLSGYQAQCAGYEWKYA